MDLLKIFVPLYSNAEQILSIEDYVTYHGYVIKWCVAKFTKSADGYKKLVGFIVCLG